MPTSSRRIGDGIAECHDLLFQPDFQPLKWHRAGVGEFQLEMGESAAKQGAVTKFISQRGNGRGAARECAIDALGGQEHAALQPEIAAHRVQRLAQLPEVRQRGKLIEGGNLAGHDEGLISRVAHGKGRSRSPGLSSRRTPGRRGRGTKCPCIACIPLQALLSGRRVCQVSACKPAPRVRRRGAAE